MTDRHRSYYYNDRPASAYPSRASFSYGHVDQPAYGDAYLVPATSRHHITKPRGYSNSTLPSRQPITTRTYAVTHDPRIPSRLREHSRSRRSTTESATRPPVIITTTQNERTHHDSPRSAAARNGSPVRDDYRYDDSQHYTLPNSTRRSQSSVRLYQEDDHTRHRVRGDRLSSPRDVASRHQTRPSVSYPKSSRYSTAAIDYGDDGYKYTNAGELARYDLDNSSPSHSRWHDSFDRDCRRSRPAFSDKYPREPRYYLDRGYVMTQGRTDGHHGQTSARPSDKINRNYDIDRGCQAPPAAPKPPRPSSRVEAAGSLRDFREIRRPVSVDQESIYRNSFMRDSHRNRDENRDWQGLRECSVDRVAERQRPNYIQYCSGGGGGVLSRGFGVRVDPAAALDGRREPKDQEQVDHLQSVETYPSRRAIQDRPSSSLDEGKYYGGGGKEADNSISGTLLEGTGTRLGLGASAAAAAAELAVFRQEDQPDKRLQGTEGSSPGVTAEASPHTELAPFMKPAARESARQVDDRHSPRQGFTRQLLDDGIDVFDSGGATSAQDNTQSTPGPNDGGKSKAIQRQRSSRSFNPNDTVDLRQIKEQLAALKVRDGDAPSDHSPVDHGGEARLSPVGKDVSNGAESEKTGESCGVGSHAVRKQTRVVSPPRDRRDDKPLKGILKQPSASFPEEANPVREGVAPHKEDKKLKEVPPGARWTKINRKVVNPEALAIGKERFEERDDFVIVLRVLSKNDIQMYAAATQLLRERRRREGDADRSSQGRHVHDGDGSTRQFRPHDKYDDEEYEASGIIGRQDREEDSELGRIHGGGRGGAGEATSADGKHSVGGHDHKSRRLRRDEPGGDGDERRRDRSQLDDRERDAHHRRRSGRDDVERELNHGGNDRYRHQ